MDSTLFYLLLFGHWVSLIVGFGAVLLIDFYGLLWMIGREPRGRVFAVADIAQKLVWLGWGGLVATGIPLTLIMAYVDQLGWLKIGLVAMIGLNGLYLDSIKKAGERLPDSEKTPFWLFYRMGLSSVVSQVGWWGAIVIGFLHRNIDHVIRWPKAPLLWTAGIFVVFGAAFLAGVLFFRRTPSGPSN